MTTLTAATPAELAKDLAALAAVPVSNRAAKYKGPAAVSKPIGTIAKDAAALFQKAKDEQKRWKAIEKEAEAVIREALGDANTGTFMGVPVVKLAYRGPWKINEEILKEVYPEAYEGASYLCEYNFIQAL